MAGNSAVWGIDIGQCSLKAIRCRRGDSPGELLADAFDYIAYPKILSQPGAEPAELIADALRLFLSRNSVRGDRVAISVPGQNGLARFIKLPPVEAGKIPDIVRYEARQQIPFDLADVIWDYQRMGGGAEQEGFALETEVGLFAMKRDQVYRHLQAFTNVGISVDIIQLAPLALYNFLIFDQMRLVPPDQYNPDDPPGSTVILSLGTDATDLVVTNGYRVWQRSIPLGGNHFTKALTKELKLTFAKAEHLKCNASSAPDPRALFQAMRPVFNDLLTEIQRSIGYFTSIDRRAKIEKIVTLGNGMKMPGLRRYLSQSLGVEVTRIEAFEHLSGPEVVHAPAFKENLLCFGVAYGLAVQALGGGRATLSTNLLPPEIVKDRFVRAKKPWALAAAALLLLGCAIGYGNRSMALSDVAVKRYQRVEQDMSGLISDSQALLSDAQTAEEDFKKAQETGKNLVGNVDNRVLWLELLRAINEALPQNTPAGQRPKDSHQWPELHIESLECQQVENLSDWFAQRKDVYRKPDAPNKAEAATGDAATPAAGDPAALQPPVASEDNTSTEGGDIAGKPGWVIRLTGYHYHNPEATSGEISGAQYVRDTLLRGLEQNEIILPTIKGKKAAGGTDEPNQELVSMNDLGIRFPMLVSQDKPFPESIRDPFADDTDAPAPGNGPGQPGIMGGMGGMGGRVGDANMIEVRRFNFTVEFAWIPSPPTARQEKKEAPAQGTDGSDQN